MSEKESMIEALKQELERNRKLLAEYKAIPSFGATMIEADLRGGEIALARCQNDPATMAKWIRILHENN